MRKAGLLYPLGLLQGQEAVLQEAGKLLLLLSAFIVGGKCLNKSALSTAKTQMQCSKIKLIG